MDSHGGGGGVEPWDTLLRGEIIGCPHFKPRKYLYKNKINILPKILSTLLLSILLLLGFFILKARPHFEHQNYVTHSTTHHFSGSTKTIGHKQAVAFYSAFFWGLQFSEKIINSCF